MKKIRVIYSLAALIILITLGCEKDELLDMPSDGSPELMKKKPVPEPEAIIDILDLGTAGGAASIAYGINVVNGDIWVVGYTHMPAGSGVMSNAFLWRQSTGVLEDLGPNLGGEWSEARDVNSDGTIVGYTMIQGYDLAIMWLPDGTIVNLDDFVASYCPDSRAIAINADGVIAGKATPDVSCSNHIFAWNLPNTTDLGNLGYMSAGATGINARGAVSGYVQVSISQVDLRAVYSSTGMASDLVILSGMENVISEARDINNNGQIVGTYDPGDITKAFLYENGSITDLPSLGGTAGAHAISEEGFVCGESRMKAKGRSNPTHAFLYHADIGTIDLGTLSGERLGLSRGLDLIEHPTEPNTLLVVGWSDNRAVLWTVDISPLL